MDNLTENLLTTTITAFMLIMGFQAGVSFTEYVNDIKFDCFATVDHKLRLARDLGFPDNEGEQTLKDLRSCDLDATAAAILSDTNSTTLQY